MSEEKRELRIHSYNSIASIIWHSFEGTGDVLTTNGGEITSRSRDGNTLHILSPTNPLLRLEQHPSKEGVGLYDRNYAFGAEEILLLDKYDLTGLELLLEFLKSRPDELRKSELGGEKLRQFHAYATYELGTLVGRLFASERIAPFIDDEIKKALSHYSQKKRCLYCDIVRQEQNESVNQESRVVFLDDNKDGYIGLVPFTPQHPYSLNIFPLKHKLRLKQFTSDQLKNLALWIYLSMDAIKEKAHQKIYLFLYSTPLYSNKDPDYDPNIENAHHLHVEIIPEGIQIPGTGWYVIPYRPKDAAKELRSIIQHKAMLYKA